MAIARQGVGIRWVLGIACDYGWEHLSACAWGAVWLTVRGHLAWLVDGQRVAIEVELVQKSIARLRAILDLHASWRAARQPG